MVIVTNASRKDIKQMHVLIVDPRRKMDLEHLILLEEVEEEDVEMDEMELNSKELAEIVANKDIKRAVVGKRKKMQAWGRQDIEYQVKVVTQLSIEALATKLNTYYVL